MNENTIINFFKNLNEYFTTPNKYSDEELNRFKVKINNEEIDKEIKDLIAKETGFDRIKELVTHEYYIFWHIFMLYNRQS